MGGRRFLAVLVAEELFASGCRLLISLTSAGQIIASGPPPYFIIIDRALRDEGTSALTRTSGRHRRERSNGHFT